MRKYWYRRILIMIATFTVAVGGSYYLIRDFKEQMKQEVSADTAGTHGDPRRDANRDISGNGRCDGAGNGSHRRN